MATIEELEQKIQRLERQMLEEIGKTDQMIEKSNKALDFSTHTYKVDHYGIIWVWDTVQQRYRKTKMRIMTPEIADEAVESRHIADNAIEGRHMTDNLIEGRMIKNKTIDGRSLKNDIIGPELIEDNSIPGDSYQAGAFKPGKLADRSVARRNIQPRAVGHNEIDDNSVGTNNIQNKSVNPSKVSDDFFSSIVLPPIEQIDQKYLDITNELYCMIRSLQVGGIALSNQFGDREDIGITQKTLTKAFGRFWEEMENITGRTYMNFTLTVVPVTTFSEQAATVNITADCHESISNFDSIKIYVDNQLIAESRDVEVFDTSHVISETSEVKAVGVILGKTITKNATAIKEIPFFMGSGAVYTDVMNTSCLKELDGTLEGNYDVTITHNGDYMFIIIPISHKDEFRRADMNGYEIPFEAPVVMEDYVVYKSLNTYLAGTYNVDIDINT